MEPTSKLATDCYRALGPEALQRLRERSRPTPRREPTDQSQPQEPIHSAVPLRQEANSFAPVAGLHLNPTAPPPADRWHRELMRCGCRPRRPARLCWSRHPKPRDPIGRVGPLHAPGSARSALSSVSTHSARMAERPNLALALVPSSKLKA